mgnify:CR=1 FL=1
MTEDFNKITADWCKEHGVTFRKLVYNHDSQSSAQSFARDILKCESCQA